ncbi:transmembrane secretion effector [Alicyclobacillus sacchari]|uniref:Transmembrane secretion effector n=1 Tax=Alicyclobacillus sacchari TaxID=392010 RepID=A0A4R8LDF4_9BACL|nr:MFS transporter [Alicyclobacillus sacchari]TDY40120.1 transmembrane secretion effector [Alicyclobacillus sacchari]GMA58092.1 MFS transporter [Alicyclobacillus sacchari]
MVDFSILKNRHFVKLWVGQSVSLFGSLVSRLALPFLVIYTMHATAKQVALLRICEVAPGIIVGLFAGVWVDRLKRRQVMIVSDVVRAILVGSIPLLLFLGHLGWAQIWLVAIAVSVFSVTFDSAYGAYIPTLVDEDQITDANAKLSATGAVSEVVGFGLSGALFEWLGGAITLSLDAVSFIFSAFTLMSICKLETHCEQEEQREPLLQELRKGLQYLWENKTLSLLSGVAGIQNIFYGISGTVYVLYISRGLHVMPGIQGVLYAVGGLGAFVTSTLADGLFKRMRFGKVFILASLVGVVGSALLPLASGPMWLLVVFILAQQLIGDGADTVFEIGVSSFCQARTTNAYLGRVNSIWQVITSICLLAGTLIGGEIATIIGLRNTLFVAVMIRLIGLALTSMSPLRKVVSIEVAD